MPVAGHLGEPAIGPLAVSGLTAERGGLDRLDQRPAHRAEVRVVRGGTPPVDHGLAVTTEAVVGRGARPAAKVIPIPSPRPVTSSGALPVRDALAASPRTAAESRAPVRRDDAAGCGRNRLQSLDQRRNGATRSKARDEGRTFCPSKGLAGYYDIAGARRAAWSYEDAYTEVQRISGLVSFEPDVVEVHLGGVRQSLEPGQNMVSHGVDRNLTLDETTAAGLP
ncbi:DUF427 domain-containing protein [Streptomyces sp. NPDC096193]|uniref:DUF427 domain-containing protein n=1 Tax=Streptomyces sp. NPDC096193 TaxID=3155821 RepID=UPI00332F9EAB